MNPQKSIIQHIPQIFQPIGVHIKQPTQRNNHLFVHSPCAPLKNPKLILQNKNLQKFLDLEDIQNIVNGDLFQYGIAHNYVGYQFGHYAGQLGDGRAILIGGKQIEDQIWELQVKGAGMTCFSRQADGRAVLRSSIREYIASEFMHYANVPTTRALCLIVSDDVALRDKFYSGDVEEEQCAIVCRVSQNFLRFGSMENTLRKDWDLKSKKLSSEQIINCLQQFYQVQGAEKVYQYIVEKTANMVAQWQCVGFCHGVMNTDNMSLLGLTIDYGPYGFMDFCDLGHICNSSDTSGRYAYSQQPQVAQWNLEKLGEAFTHVCDSQKLVQYTKDNFLKIFDGFYFEKMGKKLGIKKQYFKKVKMRIQRNYVRI